MKARLVEYLEIALNSRSTLTKANNFLSSILINIT